MSIEKRVQNTIEEFNDNQTAFFNKILAEHPSEKKKEIKYDYKRQLDQNFRKFMDDKEKKDLAIKRLKDHKFLKKEQTVIANQFFVRTSNIEKFFLNVFFHQLYTKSKSENSLLEKKILEIIQETFFDDTAEFKFLENQLKKNISLFSPFILNGGNNQNFSLLEIGINTSNQGDGAEHIFVAKAMIAGFNASKVDVGSSGYDAIIEGKDESLLKVQVKSFTTDNFSRKGRDRGGEGIDSSNRSNIGKLVSSRNCDIFVAVNKKNSELFIFSKKEIDCLPETNIKRKDYMKNWENWEKINEGIS